MTDITRAGGPGDARPTAKAGPKPAPTPPPAQAPKPDRMALSGTSPLPPIPEALPAVPEMTKLRAVREQATIMLDQGARDGRYVPTEWLTSAAHAIAEKTAGARDPLLVALGAAARAALETAGARTGEGEAAKVLAAYLKDVEARTSPGAAQPRDVLVGVRKALGDAEAKPGADPATAKAASRALHELVGRAQKADTLDEALGIARDGLALVARARGGS